VFSPSVHSEIPNLIPMRLQLLLFVVFFSNCLSTTFAQNGAVSNSSALNVTTVNVNANSLAWDPVVQQIYLTLPSTVGASGNAVQVLNPVTGAPGANVFAGSEPGLVTVSPNSQYLYVSLGGASFVQRFTLPGLGTDIKIPLGNGGFNGAYFASDIQASPASDRAVAVVRSVTGVSPSEEGGVVVYDDATPRPNVLCGFIQPGCSGSGALYNSIQWNATGATMYAANNEDTGFDFYTIPVDASGFGKATDYQGLVSGFGSSIHFDKVTGYVFADNGTIIDPVAGAIVGKIAASGLMVPDGAFGTAFFLSSSNGNSVVVQAFDMRRFTPLGSVTLSNVAGSPTHLIRWGANGLAFTTRSTSGVTSGAGPVYVLSGPFVGPAATPPPGITASGVVPIISTSTTVQTGDWISIYGSNLAGTTAIWKGDFPTTLASTSVTVDGKPAPIYFASPGQLNVKVPDDSKTGSVAVTVTRPKGTSTSAEATT
jgi:hypothetical protein